MHQPPAGKARRSLLWIRVALGLAGLLALLLLVLHAGPAQVAMTMRRSLRWLPLLCAIELLRLVAETLAARAALGRRAADIPWTTLFRANVIGVSVAALAPAPRVVNEAIKITLLGPYVGVAVATSVGFTLQAATLMSVGLFSLPCGAAIYALGRGSAWFWAAMIHAVVLVASALALRAASRAQGPGRWLSHKLPSLAAPTAEFAEHAQQIGLWGAGPTGAMLLNRILQVGQLAVAAHATGIDIGPVEALAAQGVNLIAAAVGVLVPGGFGTTDGAFVLAAHLLHTHVAQMTAMALLLRCLQLVWLLIGSVALFLQSGQPYRPK